MTYLIQYEIADDAQFLERCKSLGAWMNYFQGSIIVESNLSAKDVYDRVSVDYEDSRVLIVALDRSRYYGFMPSEAWDWLEGK